MNKEVFENYMDYLIGNAEEFELDDYSLFCKRNKISFWIGNGFLFYGLYGPVENQFTLYQKVLFHFYYLPLWKDQKAQTYLLDENQR